MWIILLIIVGLIVLGIIVIVNYSKKSNYESKDNEIDDYKIYEPKKEIKTNNTQEEFGIKGEKNVGNMLQRIVDKNKAYLFNDYTIAYKDGHSINIDHILICLGGIFVIETKSNKGTIYGNDKAEIWYAKKEAWQDDKQFNNPVKQNQGHINCLKTMFNNNPPKMYSLIIFPAANSLNNVNSVYVYDINSAYEYIIEKINESKYSIQFVDRMYTKLKEIKDTYGITIEEHINNIRNNH